jgi:hypothetical protein
VSLDIQQGEHHRREEEQQAAGDKFFGFGQADGKGHEQHSHGDFFNITRKRTIKKSGHTRQNENSRGDSGGDERNFAVRAEKSKQAAGKQQDDVGPEDDVLELHHAKYLSICNGLQVQNLAAFAFCNDLEGPAADDAIRHELLVRDARIHHDFVELPAKRASHGLGNFHARSVTSREKSSNVFAKKWDKKIRK